MIERPNISHEQSKHRRWSVPSLTWMGLALIGLASAGIYVWVFVILPPIRLTDSFLRDGGSVTFLVNEEEYRCWGSKHGGNWEGTPPHGIAEHFPPAMLYPLIGVHNNFDGQPVDGRLLSLLADAPHVKSVWLGRADFQDDGLKSISQMPHLESLYLAGSFFTASDFEHLKNLHLKKLFLEATPIDNAMLSTVSEMPTLWKLDLAATRINDDGLKHLEKLRYLQSLSLRRTRVTLDGARQLKKKLPNCVIEWESRSQTNHIRL